MWWMFGAIVVFTIGVIAGAVLFSFDPSHATWMG